VAQVAAEDALDAPVVYGVQHLRRSRFDKQLGNADAARK